MAIAFREIVYVIVYLRQESPKEKGCKVSILKTFLLNSYIIDLQHLPLNRGLNHSQQSFSERPNRPSEASVV